jgi:hypothetical protein
MEGKDPYAIYYVINNISPAELNYTVTKKEFLAVIHAINKFWHYITGYPVILHIDHAAIKYLMNKPITNGRVTRWFLLLQEYDITILNKLGKDNVVVDFLSRLTSNENEPPVEDYFPDEHLFAVSTNSPWFTDIANYLVAGRTTTPFISKRVTKDHQTKLDILMDRWLPLPHMIGSHYQKMCVRR